MDRAALQERFGIIGSSPAIHHVLDRVRLISRTDITVLIQGESGVGKELVAQAIHKLSARRHGSLVIVNCGAIPEGLIESELFGNEKGAYTGAVEKRSGYFEEANGGTIFLDEIGEMPLAAQVRLLRVLESGEFSRVGSSSIRRTDARVVAASNRDLGREVQAGRFREDLYYRLSTVQINIPPLRDRREDIVPIFEHFLYRTSQKYSTPMKRLDESARQMLMRYSWPGNIRELRNVAEQAMILVREETLTGDLLKPYLRGVSAGLYGSELVPVSKATDRGDSSDGRERELVYRALLELRMEVRELKDQIGTMLSSIGSLRAAETARPRPDFVIVRDDADRFDSGIEDVSYEIESDEDRRSSTMNGGAPVMERTAREEPLPTLENAERHLISEALKRYDGNRRQAARALGISERTLYRKLKELEEEL